MTQHMPARIWATYDGGEWSTARLSNDRLFIRADLAERMAEALENLTANIATAWPSVAHLGPVLEAKAALSAFRSTTQDTEARHD